MAEPCEMMIFSGEIHIHYLYIYSLHISWTCTFREEQMFKASANQKQDSLAAAMLLPSQEKVKHICSIG